MEAADKEVFAVECGSLMERVAVPTLATLFVFVRRGAAGTGRRSAWGIVAPLAVKICSLTE
jgi:hypothetical protein